MAPLTNHEYTIGWICALPLEMAAARAMLDENHGKPKEQDARDNNNYHLGRVQQHNVVIACLPAGVYGTTSAATVATQMLFSFPSIRFGLMVGIGGGVPAKGFDIRLGDVVVSKPDKTFGGVVQYDFGKVGIDGKFTRSGSLNKPPLVLLNAVASLQADHELEESKIPQYLQETFAKYTKLQADYSYQGVSNDRLFDAVYEHIQGDTCDSCDAARVVCRSDRNPSTPFIHYGVIASGNSVIKDAVTRDRVRDELGIICFEMEAAGLVDHFPCLVIRGICDYADSHKNKRWQRYAAATAAAYAKELLSIIPTNQVDSTPFAAEALKADQYRNKLLAWLTPKDYGLDHSDIFGNRQKGTGLWLVDSSEFSTWLNGVPKTLFCPGIPGAGKTIMASIVVNRLLKTFPPDTYPDHRTGIAFLYCSYNKREEQKGLDLLSALLKQLIQQQPDIPQLVKDLYDHYLKIPTRPSFEDISKSLLTTIKTCYSRVFIVVDALDECEGRARADLLSEIRDLQAQSDTKLMATSRLIAEITQEFKEDISFEIRARKEDIEQYLDGDIPRRLPRFVSQSPALLQLVKAGIAEAVDGMFLLARLHLDSLADKPTEKAITSALKELPRGSEGLDQAYGDAVKRIDNQAAGFRNLAKRVLGWITYAQRQLNVRELQHALAVEKGDRELDETNIPGINEVVSVCAGLITIDPESNIIRLVHYTTQEHFERIRAAWIPDAPTNIAITCLTYLSFKTFESGCSPSDDEFEDRLAQNVFLSYAASHWANHAREVQVNVREVALPFLKNTSLVSASNQAMSTPKRRYHMYSQSMQTTGLHLAARFGLQELLASLLGHNEYADFKDFDGRTPLWWAAANGHEAVVRLLVEKGAELEPKNILWDGTPLWRAAAKGHEAVVRLLVEKGAELESKDREYGQTPLWCAAANGHEAVVRLLVEKGAELESKDIRWGGTPLWRAAAKGHEAVVRLLVEKGAELESKDTEFGVTPLWWAAADGHEAVVRLLVEKGAELESKDIRWGQTPLWEAAANGHEAVVRLLVEKGAKLESKDKYGGTPLLVAADNGHEAVVKLLTSFT